jgi:hypothetical protein
LIGWVALGARRGGDAAKTDWLPGSRGSRGRSWNMSDTNGAA